jgi:hypothetical protein
LPTASFAPLQPTSVDAATLGMFSRMPVAAAPLLDLAAEDETLHAVALGANARVTLDAGSAGELALHVRVRDGVADLRVDGAAAQSLDIRANEIRTALAGEGISLGRFETAGSSPPLAAPQGAPSELASGPSADAGASGASLSGSPAQSQSHSQSQSHDGRPHGHFEDRWGDAVATPRPSGSLPTSPDTAPSTPQRRRGLHVTA